MKYKFWMILAVLIAALAFWGCKGGSAGFSSIKENFDKDPSYALGMSIGASLAVDGIVPNLDAFIQGMKDSLSGGQTRFDEEEAIMKIETAYQDLREKKENSFLAENAGKSGVVVTPSGLQYEVIVERNGPKPTVSDSVRVHYEGRLIDGMIFDSSYMRGAPAEFPLEFVIPGWSEGLQLMGVGSKYRLYIPSNLGYGQYRNESIPPFSTLIFEVELLEIL